MFGKVPKRRKVTQSYFFSIFRNKEEFVKSGFAGSPTPNDEGIYKSRLSKVMGDFLVKFMK